MGHRTLRRHPDLGPAGLPRPQDKRRRLGNLAGTGGKWPWIEAIFGILKVQFGLDYHGGRTPLPACSPASPRRILVLAACIWNN
jgi:hypothetical protein